MYQNNLLSKPGGISMKNVPINLADIDIPAYFLSCREDHIAPWKSTYIGARLFGGSVRFVLASSGHIAGVVNPPENGKYNHFINNDLPESADEWLREATEVAGSWWPDWQRWVTGFDKSQVPARIPGKGKLKAIEAAPGSYVTVPA
jgi:polyhydroxyalkanoate synthase